MFSYRAVFKFDGQRIVCSEKGDEFNKFKEHFAENERGFGYIRLQAGDEMSKRQKFLFITWIGPAVSVIQRAKMSTDKSMMKDIIKVWFFSYYLMICFGNNLFLAEFRSRTTIRDSC